MDKNTNSSGSITLLDIIVRPRYIQDLARGQKKVKRGLLISLGSAFFIVFIAALALNYFLQFQQNAPLISLQENTLQEPVAYQPGQVVSQYIQEGYIGKIQP